MPKNQPTYHESSLFPVLTSEQLLTGQRLQLSRKIEQLIAAPPEHFQELYNVLMANFAEFVQALPAKIGGPLGELLYNGLVRGQLAAKIYLDEITDEPDPLYLYAAFSAALLQDLTVLLVDKKIMVSDEEGRYLHDWQPLAGSMVKLNYKYYKLRSFDCPLNSISASLTLLYTVKHLMPEIGLLWIADDIALFKKWAAALSGDYQGAGGLGDLLMLVKKRFPQQTTYVPMQVETTEPNNVAAGEDFIAWLKEHLDYINQEGVVTVNAFDKFAEEYPKHADREKLLKQLKELGVVKAMHEREAANVDRTLSIDRDMQQESKIAQKNLLKQTLLGKTPPAVDKTTMRTASEQSFFTQTEQRTTAERRTIVEKRAAEHQVIQHDKAVRDTLVVLERRIISQDGKSEAAAAQKPSAAERFAQLEKLKIYKSAQAQVQNIISSFRGSR